MWDYFKLTQDSNVKRPLLVQMCTAHVPETQCVGFVFISFLAYWFYTLSLGTRMDSDLGTSFHFGLRNRSGLGARLRFCPPFPMLTNAMKTWLSCSSQSGKWFCLDDDYFRDHPPSTFPCKNAARSKLFLQIWYTGLLVVNSTEGAPTQVLSWP